MTLAAPAPVRYRAHMSDHQRTLHWLYCEALDLATATRKDIARAMGRGRRTVEMYVNGGRRLTAGAVEDMVGYLRRRARELEEVADALEAAMEEEDEGR